MMSLKEELIIGLSVFGFISALKPEAVLLLVIFMIFDKASRIVKGWITKYKSKTTEEI